eukprot:TRINITY_DN7932_c0_g1_i1.p1 TRINITY_DN7932_c0_g1~~TRINITY_DN7932_c0_g1_i1.p1  ORF type:complete len:146 (-),score=38.51 TRINITY_DN7932_c0_g1_i1:253-690(-)
MIRRPPRSTQSRSSAASDVYKRQLRPSELLTWPNGRRIAKLTKAWANPDFILTTEALQPPFSLKVSIGDLPIKRTFLKSTYVNSIYLKAEAFTCIGLTDVHTATPVAGSSLMRKHSVFFYHKTSVEEGIYVTSAGDRQKVANVAI